MTIIRGFLLISILATSSLSTLGAEPSQGLPVELNEGERAEHRRLNGKWVVKSAAYQMSGTKTYVFNNGILVVTNRTFPGLKEGRELPPQESIERYQYSLNIARFPTQLILTPIGPQARKEQKRIYEFRDGHLWMCPDDQQNPKGRSSLRIDQFGDGWLEGLEPLK